MCDEWRYGVTEVRQEYNESVDIANGGQFKVCTHRVCQTVDSPLLCSVPSINQEPAFEGMNTA